ncbi:MAG: hypothetical protein ISP86_05070 [Shewanellaceae bacterium]|nr:hypothetical protein [Shewanellaceae bacterium]
MKFFWCLWLGMMSATTSANSLLELYGHKNNASLWTQRDLEIKEVADYMYRHYSLLMPTHGYIRQILSHDFLNKYNGQLYDSLSGNHLHPVAERQLELLSNHIDHYLQHLPTLEFTSYLPLYYPKAVIDRYQVGLGVYEPGFIRSYTNLPHAFSAQEEHFLQQVQMPELSQEYVKVVAEIQGKRGRILKKIMDPNTPMVLWPRQTHYKIEAKQYIEAENLYMFRYKEISATEARALPRVIASYSGHAVPNALVECNSE